MKELPAETGAAVSRAIVDAFRLTAIIAAGLAWLSAALSWFMVEERMTPAPSP